MRINKYFKINQFQKNMLSGSILQGLNILVVLISYPLYIKYLGLELFSVWILLSVVIAFATMGELGISKAIISFIAKAKVENDLIEIRRIASNSMYIVLVSSTLILITLWHFNDVICSILEIPEEHLRIAISVIPYIGISIGSYVIYDVLSGIVAGMGRLDISNLLLFALNILKVISSVIFLQFNFQLFSMVYGILFANLLFIIVVPILICSKFDKAILKPVMFSKKSTLELLKFGYSIIGMQVMNMFSFPFIKVILAKTIGIEAIGIFELSSKAGYALRTLFGKGLFAIMPEISYISKNLEGANLGNSVIYNKVIRMSKY